MSLRQPVRVSDCIAQSIRTSRATGSGAKKKSASAQIDFESLSQSITAILAQHKIDLTQAQRGIVSSAVNRAARERAESIRAPLENDDISTIVLWECELFADIKIVKEKAKKSLLSVVISADDKKRAADISQEEINSFLESKRKRFEELREKPGKMCQFDAFGDRIVS